MVFIDSIIKENISIANIDEYVQVRKVFCVFFNWKFAGPPGC